jgi:transposase-like protein
MPFARLTQREIELRNQAIQEGLKSGQRMTDLAKTMRVNVRTVARWVRLMEAEGLVPPDVDLSISEMPRQRFSVESRLDEVSKLSQNGFSHKQMAAALGISTRHVFRCMSVLNGNKLPPRNQRNEEENQQDKLCSLCGFRFDAVIRDSSATKCEACYQFLLQKAECQTCGIIFVDQSRGLKDKRSECWTCKPSLVDLSEKLPRMWRDERWFSMFSQHQEGCLVCGSSRAKTRDGRFCSWEHDPDFLDDGEAEALLSQFWSKYAIK